MSRVHPRAILATDSDPGVALAKWVEGCTALVAAKQGFAAALNSNAPGLHEIGPYVRERLEPALQTLLDAARQTGDIRSELSAEEIITALALLCHPVLDEDVSFNQDLVRVFLEGLR